MCYRTLPEFNYLLRDIDMNECIKDYSKFHTYSKILRIGSDTEIEHCVVTSPSPGN